MRVSSGGGASEDSVGAIEAARVGPSSLNPHRLKRDAVVRGEIEYRFGRPVVRVHPDVWTLAVSKSSRKLFCCYVFSFVK